MRARAILIPVLLLVTAGWQLAGCGASSRPVPPARDRGAATVGSDRRALAEPDIGIPGYLEPFTDPVFGTTVERVTDARSLGADFVVNEYSKADPWNCDGSRMLVTDSRGEWMLLDGATYRVRDYVKAASGERLASSPEPRWHPTDPDAFYYVDGASFMKYSCYAGKGKALHTFREYEAISATGEGNLSLDGGKIALAGHGGPEGTPRDVFVYYIDEDRVGPRKSVAGAPEGIDWVSVTPKGDYVMILWGVTGGGPFQGGELFDLEWNLVGRLTKGCHHGDFALEKDGGQAFVMAGANDPDFEDAARIVKYSIPACKATPILDVDWYNGLHVSGRCSGRPGWVVVSTYHEWAEEGGGPEHGDPEGDWDPFENEVFALAIDGSGRVVRLAHDHAEKRLYFEEPHAVTNRDLTRVAFSTNWGRDIGEQKSDVYVIEVPRSMVRSQPRAW